MDLTVTILKREEGYNSNGYYDSLGFPTIGYGIKTGNKGDPLVVFTLPQQVADVWLSVIVDNIRKKISDRISSLNEARQAVIISMCYQLGINGCFKFTGMWKAIDNQDWEKAGDEIIDSKAYHQCQARYLRLRQVMKSGDETGIY
jgi:lysozyme